MAGNVTDPEEAVAIIYDRYCKAVEEDNDTFIYDRSGHAL
jgi:hypothetical protein